MKYEIVKRTELAPGNITIIANDKESIAELYGNIPLLAGNIIIDTIANVYPGLVMKYWYLARVTDLNGFAVTIHGRDLTQAEADRDNEIIARYTSSGWKITVTAI